MLKQISNLSLNAPVNGFSIILAFYSSCSIEFGKVQPSIVFRVDQIKFGCSGRVRGGGGAACCQKLRLEKLVPPLPAFNTVRPGKHSHFPLPFSQEWPGNPPVPSPTLLHSPPSLKHFPNSFAFAPLLTLKPIPYSHHLLSLSAAFSFLTP